MKGIQKTVVWLLLSMSVWSIGCSNDDTTSSPTPSAYVSESNYTLDQLEEASSIKIMTYQMPGIRGQEVQATALVFYPNVPKPADGWRMVMWAHGTVGVSDDCAPSNKPISANFKVSLKRILQEGYVVVAPDYEGLGTPGIHPYLNLKSGALSCIYAVHALKQKYSGDFQGDWISSGQSQGGQASLGVAEYASEDASYKGAIAGAPGSNLGKIILEVAPNALRALEAQENKANPPIPLEERNSVVTYATLLAYGALSGVGLKAEHPTFDYTVMFKGRSKTFASLAEGSNGEDGLCLDGIRNAYKADIIQFMKEEESRKVMDYPGINEEAFQTNSIVKASIVANQPGTKKIDKPVLVIQGTADTNVPYTITQELVDHLKELGSTQVELLLVKGASHTQAIVQSTDQLIAFIKQYLPSKAND